MSGRGAGYCTGWKTTGPGFGWGANRGGRRQGLGFGGRGCRNRWTATGQPGWMRCGGDPAADAGYPPMDAEAEKRFLERQAGTLQAHLESVRSRLARMKGVQGD